MSPDAGMMLVSKILPLIQGAVGRGAVRPVGCEDTEELQAEGCALAAAILESAEAKNHAVQPGTVAYYALQALKSGRRSGYAGAADAMCPAAQLRGRTRITSLDAPLGYDDDPGDDLTLHDVLAGTREDAASAVARRLDWNDVIERLDTRRRTVLEDTAVGLRTRDIAAKLGFSAPYVCQLRDSMAPVIADCWGGDVLQDVAEQPVWRKGMRAATERRARHAAS